MTIDERLEKLTETVELLAHRQEEEWERSREEYARSRQEDERLRAEAREADARFQARIDEVLEGIDALARLAGVQGVRLDNHEGRISTLEKGTPPSTE